MKENRNLLSKEKSLYLREHADNPVNWHPWRPETLKKAREEGKPLFVSIGYSSCHWCHVMRRESFEDEEVAQILNENFIPVKADREERPDVDKLFMEGCIAATGQGGWPLNAVATPEGKPFVFFTYLPKERLIRVLKQVARIWREDRKRVLEAAEEVVRRVSALPAGYREVNSKELLKELIKEAEGRFDPIYGGFSPAPKFPRPQISEALLKAYEETGSPEAFAMATLTLKAMRLGGIYDQIGGGFHRYSVDGMWLIPHFEKMLYDQAGLLLAYARAYKESSYWLFKETAEGILKYLERELSAPDGLFYSSQDAESEGKEGAFYIWSLKEVEEALTGEELKLAKEIYKIGREGNFEGEKSVLFIGEELEEIAERLGLSLRELLERKAAVDRKLFKAREERERPRVDKKVVVGWSSFTAWALIEGGKALGDKKMEERGLKAVRALLEKGVKGEEVFRVIYGGEPQAEGTLEDYAFLIRALISAGKTEEALRLTERALTLFHDETGGGFFLYRENELPVRLKEPYDGAYRSSYSVMVENLMELSKEKGIKEFEEIARRAVNSIGRLIEQSPLEFSGIALVI